MINASDTPPSVLISGSATGYYGDLGEVVVTEEEPPHNEFTHKLCARWEEIACRAQSDKTRVCLLRTGVVLAPDGGILGKMLPPFRLGLGGPIGSGRQYLAWIHIDDMVNGILWLLDNELRGHLIWFRPTRYAMNNLPMRSVMRCIARPFCASPRPPFDC
ncbi:NAD(P)-binding Rossmann-fold domain [Escherichia coli]|uniref:NAD(P)-binding Rossmann-fold domain n=1 Tax=Escherichia coli TaxID=562 RepID=A0A377CZZ0_ECOLX|nr:NAD(P)-binding Rossmann-fold domain [Escherichia coli]